MKKIIIHSDADLAKFFDYVTYPQYKIFEDEIIQKLSDLFTNLAEKGDDSINLIKTETYSKVLWVTGEILEVTGSTSNSKDPSKWYLSEFSITYPDSTKITLKGNIKPSPSGADFAAGTTLSQIRITSPTNLSNYIGAQNNIKEIIATGTYKYEGNGNFSGFLKHFTRTFDDGWTADQETNFTFTYKNGTWLNPGNGVYVALTNPDGLQVLNFDVSDFFSQTGEYEPAYEENYRKQFFENSDFITGTPSNDSISSYAGNDTVTSGAGNDVLMGGEGNDKVVAGLGEDDLIGGAGNDLLDGGAGDDELYGGDGNDSVSAGDGSDMIIGGDGAGNDTYDGGKGIDSVKYTSAFDGITVDLLKGTATSRLGNDAAGIGTDKLKNIEYIIAGEYADLLFGSKDANSIDGGMGNDTIDGGLGNDTSVGGDGTDRFVFSTALSVKNVDTITDFQVGVDKIQLNKKIFAKLINAADFLVLDAKSDSPSHYVIYDSATGKLSYDADGNLSKVKPVTIALIGQGLELTAADFLIA